MSKAKGLGKDDAATVGVAWREVTEWPDATPNHTYLVDKNKGWLLAYRNVLTGEVMKFQNPLKQFSKTRRKFKKVIDRELQDVIL